MCWNISACTFSQMSQYQGGKIQGVLQKCTNRINSHDQNWVLWGMTWGRLILLSIRRKRPKNTFQIQVVPTTGDWACGAPWHHGTILLVHFLGQHVLFTPGTTFVRSLGVNIDSFLVGDMYRKALKVIFMVKFSLHVYFCSSTNLLK